MASWWSTIQASGPTPWTTPTPSDGQGGTAQQVITITVTGTNDAPPIGGTISGGVTEDGTQVVSGQLTKTDVDTTDTHTWTLNNAGKGIYGSFVRQGPGPGGRPASDRHHHRDRRRRQRR
ncbi:hypothetical protein G6F66_015014 [Rhizopus arrhizus]|nr:hypothetical protein G6F66_015014 [Rhizopus arrhizus]